MFTVHALPAANGDAILLEYGAEPVRRVLVDGGTAGSAEGVVERLRALGVHRLDLLVVTHVDTDHIGGVLSLFQRPGLGIAIDRVWFNGFVHLRPRRKDALGPADRLGPIHGERLTAELVAREQRGETTWNAELDGGSVVVPPEGELVEADVAGLRLTVLSPTWEKLEKLRPKWEPLVRAGGLVEGHAAEPEEDGRSDRLGDEPLDVERLAAKPPSRDGSEANGSSIALLAEHGDHRVLLAGDAHPEVLVSSLARLPAERRILELFKLPHHGSAANVTSALVQAATCKRYLFSTNGEGFKNPHPHREAVSRVIVHGGDEPALLFNYASATNLVWKRLPRLGHNARYRYTASYGDAGALAVPLS